MKNLNIPVTSKEFESVNKNLPVRKGYSLMALPSGILENSMKNLKDNESQSFSNSSKKLKRKKDFQTNFLRLALP